jgi:hypothetical protein
MGQYPIPQFIEEEGRIIFFLTFRQFFILIGGGVACLLLYFFLPFYLFVAGSILIGLLVAIIAFLKINNESVFKVLFDFLTFSAGTKRYTWDKKETMYPFRIKQQKQGSATTSIQESKLSSIKKLVETKK